MRYAAQPLDAMGWTEGDSLQEVADAMPDDLDPEALVAVGVDGKTFGVVTLAKLREAAHSALTMRGPIL